MTSLRFELFEAWKVARRSGGASSCGGENADRTAKEGATE